MKKKGVIIVILIFAAIIILLTAFSSPAQFIFENIKNQLSQNEKIIQQNENPKANQNTNSNGGGESGVSAGGTDESDASNGASGESGGEQGISQEENPQQGCIEQKFSYSLKNFTSIQKCNNQDENGNCLDKTVDCSTDIQNLEDSSDGTFGLNIIFYDEAVGPDDGIKTIEQEKTINAQEIQNFAATLVFTNDDAQKSIQCSFTTSTVPKKQIC